MKEVLKMLWNSLMRILKSRYKWIFILFVIWMYRVDFMPADGGGLAKGIQVLTTFGMLYLIYRNQHQIIGKSIKKTNNAVRWGIYLYIFATVSAAWAYIPTFAGFLGFQNVVIFVLLVWMFGKMKDFYMMEKGFLLLTVSLFLFEAILYRALIVPSIFIHYLPAGSTAGICLSYCVGELMSKRLPKDKERQSLLRGCALIALVVLVTSTSSGANASAIFGVAVAAFVSGKLFYAVLLASSAGFLFVFREYVDDLIYFIMPGKTRTDIETTTGRSFLWEYIKRLADERPWFGWGFGCVERAATDAGSIEAPDAHNNFLGLYGSLGYVGSAIAYIYMAYTALIAWGKRLKPGYCGLLSAWSCAMLNGYSFGFLSGKACSITISFFAITVLTYTYSKYSYDK